MNSVKVTPPKLGMLDWYASVAAGWNPATGENAPYSFGNLTRDVSEFPDYFRALIKQVSEMHPELLGAISNVAEPGDFPEVTRPIEENMVVLDPACQEETGLYPVAAYWQSGWEDAAPHVFVRQQVYDRLLAAVKILRAIDPDLSLCITDGWRSVHQQTELYRTFYPNGHIEGEPVYVSAPSWEDEFAAPHPSGGAVDVLLRVKDQVIRIGSDYEVLDASANVEHFEKDEHQPIVRMMRRFFANVMEEVGFVTIDSEWWHMEYGTRRWAGKHACEPLYGNAVVDKSLHVDIEPVAPIPGSRAALNAELA